MPFTRGSYRRQFVAAVLIALGCAAAARGVKPSIDELAAARKWEQEATDPKTTPLFSLTVGGKLWSSVHSSWARTRDVRQLDSRRTETTVVFTSPDHGLELRVVVAGYRDFPVVEWTVYVKNVGAEDSPVIADLRPLDIELQRDGREFVLHHNIGSPANLTDFAPLATRLPPGGSLRLAGDGGRPTGLDWSYFNLEWDQQGLIAAIGWPGQWCAELSRDGDRTLRLRAGQETLSTTLHPGEEIRSPLIVLLPWEGRDWIDAQILWRRWMIAHNTPRAGKHSLEPAALACSSHQLNEMMGATERNQIQFIDRYLEAGLPIDYWWMDTGWYKCDGSWAKVGTWEVDPQRFPRGLRAITDHARRRDTKSVVWFEPERVAQGTWLIETHPDWVIPTPTSGGETHNLLDIGNPDARNWLVEHVSRLIDEQGVDLYRQDFNIDPLRFWQSRDRPDRRGFIENRYVTGYLAYWDELLRRHPSLLIDSCASGGRRNDVESMRRAVPRTRSDYLIDPIGEQCHTYGLAMWLPYYGTGFMDVATARDRLPDFAKLWGTLTAIDSTKPAVLGQTLEMAPQSRYSAAAFGRDDRYPFRSAMCPSMTWCLDVRRDDLDYERLRALLTQWRQSAPAMAGDFYPLTPYSTGTDVWMAWQFNRPDRGDGIIQAFRRHESLHPVAELRLLSLESQAMYEVVDVDHPTPREIRGDVLMREGLRVELPQRPQAALIRYKRILP